MQTSFRSMDPTTPSADVSLLRFTPSKRIEARERKVDQVLADSFPASDPPPWTFGRVISDAQNPNLLRNTDDGWSYQTTVIVAAGGRTTWQWLASCVGAIGVAVLVPISILAVGLPIALAVRGLLEVVGWLN
jgi:hypothetical protein